MRRLHRVEDAAREVRLYVVLFYDVAVVSTDRVEEGEIRHAAMYCWSWSFSSTAAPAALRWMSAAQLSGTSVGSLLIGFATLSTSIAARKAAAELACQA